MEKNLKLMKDAWSKEISDGLQYIEDNMGEVIIESLIKSVKLSKVADTMSGPMLRQVYNIFLNDLESQTIKQLDVFIDAAKEYNGNNLDEIFELYKKRYLKFDITAQNLKKKHKNYDEIVAFQLQTYRHRIVETANMMKVGESTSYEEIIKKTYLDEKTAKKQLFKQIGYTQKAINLIIQDMSVLKIPEMIKRPVIDVLKMGYKHTLEYLKGTTQDLYS